jgi:hypothetical protein
VRRGGPPATVCNGGCSPYMRWISAVKGAAAGSTCMLLTSC